MRLLRQLMYILNSRDRIEGSILLCGMALGALFEAVGIGLILPFIAVLKEPRLAFEAPIAQPILAFLDIQEPLQLLITIGAGLIAAFVIKSIYLVSLHSWLCRYVSEKQVELAKRVLTGYLNAPYTFRLERNSAELIRTATTTIQRFATGFLIGLLVVLGELLVLLAIMLLLLVISPLSTIGALVTLGVPAVLLYRIMRHRLATSGRRAEQSNALMIQWTEQAVNGIKETLITGNAPFFVERQGRYARDFAECQRSVMLFSTIPRLVIDTMPVTAIVVVVLIIIGRGEDPGSVVPVLAMFAVAAMRLMPSAARISNALTHLRFHYAAAEVLYNELRSIEQAMQEHDSVLLLESVPARPFECSVVLEHVSYSYPASSQPALGDISLEIPKGHWVGFVGPTGAGKSTLIDLILGLFAPTSGRVLVDGHELQGDVRGWQRNLGFVPQNVYILDDTVRRNVAFGVQERDVDDRQVWRALRAAQIDDRVRSLPGGLDTVVGERGSRMSGGERQRLGIARALYRDPQVLIIDEGTANLDNETEAAIVRSLAELRGDKTIIVVAHRLALVTECDQVYYLRKGRLLRSGAFADLVSTDPGFRQFAGTAA